MGNSKYPKMRDLIDRWSIFTIPVFIFIKFLQCVKRFFPPKEDGWRRATRAYYRNEHAKFGFGVFRIKPLPEAAAKASDDAAEALMLRLSGFLHKYPLPYITLDWGRLSVKISKKRTCDIVSAGFDAGGSLTRLTPILERCGPALPPEMERMILQMILRQYNKTRALPDKIRPRRLKKAVMKEIRHSYPRSSDLAAATDYANRILSAVYVCLDRLPEGAAPERRFQDPDFTRMKHPGFSSLVLYIACDFAGNDADIWVSCSHITTDGVPVTEMLLELKKEWGENAPVMYPCSGFRTNPVRCSSVSQGIYSAELFLDFSSFFTERKRLAQTHGVKVQVLSLLSWGLARHPAFAPITLILPVELNPASNCERSLGLLYMRPAKHYDESAPEKGFLRYLGEFSALENAAKNRRSASCELIDSFALLPPPLYMPTLKLIPKTMGSIIGTMPLSVVKEAEFVIGALSDANPDGFIAFGCLNKPSIGGGTVGVVSIKGNSRQLEAYSNALKEIFQDFTV